MQKIREKVVLQSGRNGLMENWKTPQVPNSTSDTLANGGGGGEGEGHR